MSAADAERFRGALMLAAAQAAMGAGATIFLQLDAVALLRGGAAPRDPVHRAAGLPELDALIGEALALGVEMIACQSGMALCGMVETDLPAGTSVGGPVGFLQATDDQARLLIA